MNSLKCFYGLLAGKPESRYQIPESRYQIPDTRYQNPEARAQNPDCWILETGNWKLFRVLRTAIITGVDEVHPIWKLETGNWKLKRR